MLYIIIFLFLDDGDEIFVVVFVIFNDICVYLSFDVFKGSDLIFE